MATTELGSITQIKDANGNQGVADHGSLPYCFSETPLIRSGQHNVKNLIIGILAERWPLSARQIHKEIRLGRARDITYQGVHKAIRQLAQQGIVRRGAEGNRLNDGWIGDLQEYSNYLHANYSTGRNTDFYQMLNGESVTMEFPNYFQAVEAVLEVMNREHERNPEPDAVILNLDHPLPVIGLSARIIERLTGNKNASYCAKYASSTPADRKLARLWNLAGVQAKFPRTPGRSGFDIVSKGLVMHVLETPGWRRRIDRLFSRANAGTSDNLLAYTNACLDGNGKTVLTITRNPQLAEGLRREEMRAFKGQTRRQGNEK